MKKMNLLEAPVVVPLALKLLAKLPLVSARLGEKKTSTSESV